MHTECTDLFSAYLDGELDPATRRRVDAHLAGCAECSRILAELREIVVAAPEYEGNPPGRDLWPGIRAAIESSKAIPFPIQRTVPRRFQLRHLIAAGLVMAAVGAGASWYLRPRPQPLAQSPVAPPVLTAPAPTAVWR